MTINEQKYVATSSCTYDKRSGDEQLWFEVLTLNEFPDFVEKYSSDVDAVIMAFERAKLTEPVLQYFWHYEDLYGGDCDDPTGMELTLELLDVYKSRERQRLNEELVALEAL